MMHDVVTSQARRDECERRGWWDGSTLAGQVATWAASAPARIAVVDADGSWTYRQLRDDADRVAACLQANAVAPGDVVSIQLPNEYAAVVAAVAAQSIGAVINPLLPNYRQRELADVFATATPKAIFTPAVYRDFDHVALLADVAEETGVRPFHLVAGDLDALPSSRPSRTATAASAGLG